MPSVEDRLEAVMAAPLESLVDPAHQVVSGVRGWQLPESDLLALAEHGLPDDTLMTPAFQTDTEPTLVPNLAGPRERELATSTDRLYDLGGWGSHDLTPKMGAVRDEGRVLAIRPAPVTAADLHPDLREHYRDLRHPAVDFINSSVVQLVDVSWRWRAALPVLLELPELPLLPSEEEIDAHFTRLRGCEDIVLAGIQRIDPAIRADDPQAFWVQVVTDPGH